VVGAERLEGAEIVQSLVRRNLLDDAEVGVEDEPIGKTEEHVVGLFRALDLGRDPRAATEARRPAVGSTRTHPGVTMPTVRLKVGQGGDIQGQLRRRIP
jgi:hypothetical protein